MKESKHSVAIKMQTHKHYIGAMNSERSASTRNMRAIQTTGAVKGRPYLEYANLYQGINIHFSYLSIFIQYLLI